VLWALSANPKMDAVRSGYNSRVRERHSIDRVSCSPMVVTRKEECDAAHSIVRTLGN
jgi:hypothetical protein